MSDHPLSLCDTLVSSASVRWGQEFLQHSYLYHLTRLDHRHNFSPYFYPIYLKFFLPLNSSTSDGFFRSVLRSPLISFVPQFGLSLGIGMVYGAKDLRFAWFVQMLAFVGFNKVVTSQVSLHSHFFCFRFTFVYLDVFVTKSRSGI